MDMHSGGGRKEKFEYLYVELPEKDALVFFQNRFGHNPERVTCTCCGSDYSTDENPTLEKASAYDRNCRWDEVVKGYVEEPDCRYGNKELISLEEYLKREDVKVIRRDEIKDEELEGELRSQGYVWVD